MRNIEECKAEVFRRSKERIETRKKIKQRAIVCCTSLCFLLAVGVVLPGLGPTNEMSTYHKDGAVGSVAPVYVYVKGAKDGSAFQILDRITEKSEVKISYDVIVGFFDGEFTAKDNAMEGTAKDYELGGCAETEEQNRDTAKPDGKDETTGELKYQMNANATYGGAEQATIYEFVFQVEDGKITEFRLSGNELTDRTNGRKIILTEEQLQTLKTQFGIEEE